MLIKSNNLCSFSFLPRSHMDDGPCSSLLQPNSKMGKRFFHMGWAVPVVVVGFFFLFSSTVGK